MRKILSIRRKWAPVLDRFQTRGLLSGLRFKIVIYGNHSKIDSVKFEKYKNGKLIGEEITNE